MSYKRVKQGPSSSHSSERFFSPEEQGFQLTIPVSSQFGHLCSSSMNSLTVSIRGGILFFPPAATRYAGLLMSHDSDCSCPNSSVPIHQSRTPTQRYRSPFRCSCVPCLSLHSLSWHKHIFFKSLWQVFLFLCLLGCFWSPSHGK